jgi:transposase-like protein
LNNVVEQDHRFIQRLVRTGLNFECFVTAIQTMAGYEVMAVIRKGQITSASAHGMEAQRNFLAVCSALLVNLHTCPAIT